MPLLREVVAWLRHPDQWRGDDAIPTLALEHLEIAVLATVLAAIVALPLAVYLAHHRRAEFAAAVVVNVGRAVPSFGVIVIAALLFLRVGVGLRFWPIVVALFLLALPPMFTNAYAAVRGVDPALVEAARGMGLREREVLLSVELPLGAPVLLAGVRVAFVQVVATVALGAIVSSGGGLGRYVVDGFARGASGHDEVFGGALLIAAMTLTCEGAFGLLQRALLPRGLQGTAARAVTVHDGQAA